MKMARRPLLNSNIPAFNLAISTLLRNPSLLIPNYTIPTFAQFPDELGPHLHAHPAAASPSDHHASRRIVKTPRIRALVLDKDNTLTPPHSLRIPSPYLTRLHELRTSPNSPFNAATNPHGVLIVSNTSGSNARSPHYEAEARELESRLAELQIPVFRAPRAHSPSLLRQTSSSPSLSEKEGEEPAEKSKGPYLKKPFSHASILSYFTDRGVVSSADEIAVVGDRLATDVLMAGLMGAWSVWVRDGVTVGSAGGEEGLDHRGFLAKCETRLERYLRRQGVKPTLPEGWEAD